MGRKESTLIEFDSPATVAERIEALEDLRAKVGPDAVVRVVGFVEFNSRGPRVKGISAEVPARVE